MNPDVQMDNPQTADDGEDYETWRDTEHRRIFCLQEAIAVALSAQRLAPNAPLLNIMQTAEEMLDFIETGVARTHQAPAAKQ